MNGQKKINHEKEWIKTNNGKLTKSQLLTNSKNNQKNKLNEHLLKKRNQWKEKQKISSKNASYYKNSNIYIPKVAKKTTFNSRKSNIKEQQASKRPTTPTIRTPEQIAAAEERRTAFLERQEKAAIRSKERREKSKTILQNKKIEKEDALFHLGELKSSKYKNQHQKTTTNRKKRTTMMNTPIVTKYTGTFASEPFPTHQRRKNTKQSRRNGNIDPTGTKGTTGRSNTINNKNRASANNYNNKNSTMKDEMKNMNRYCTFDRRFSRNQPIGMELEWSSQQGLVVKTVDPSGQAMQMDVIRNDIVLLIAGEDISTNANNITDAEIVQKVNTLDTSVWVRFQRDLYPGKGTKQIQPTQSVDNTINDTNSNTNPKNNFNEKKKKKKKKNNKIKMLQNHKNHNNNNNQYVNVLLVKSNKLGTVHHLLNLLCGKRLPCLTTTTTTRLTCMS